MGGSEHNSEKCQACTATRAAYKRIVSKPKGPDVMDCPRCGRKSLEVVRATGRVWCLYAATCGYSS